jgi:hypothetical protein
MHPCLSAFALVAAALSAGVAHAGDTPDVTPPPQLTTTVLGSIPDLTGRWLLVAELSPQGQQLTIPVAYGWEVTTPGGKPALAFRWGGLPPAVQASLDDAIAKTEAWRPTPQQLDDIRQGWDTLPPDLKPLATVETTISGADAEPEVLKGDAQLAGSLFAVQTVMTFQPGGGRPIRDAIVLGAKERTADGYRGNYLSTTVAAAPFPIPISFTGTFTLRRLTPPPQPGFLRRLLDVFAGCGRPATS